MTMLTTTDDDNNDNDYDDDGNSFHSFFFVVHLFYRRRETRELGENIWQKMKFIRAGSVAYETQIDFLSFVQLYRSFK